MKIMDGNTFTLRVGKGSRTTFQVETVVSDKARQKGLSGRAPLESGTGMLFVFDSLSKQSMWMIDMKFPLDIVWLDEQMTIVHCTYSADPCKSRSDCPSYSSKYRVKYAIEMKAGDSEQYGFTVGKQLSIV